MGFLKYAIRFEHTQHKKKFRRRQKRDKKRIKRDESAAIKWGTGEAVQGMTYDFRHGVARSEVSVGVFPRSWIQHTRV